MKIAASKVDAFVARPAPGIRAILIYGPDGGTARERARILVAGVLGGEDDPFRLSELTGQEIVKDPVRLTDEATARSLTGGRRAVRVRDATDGAAAAVRLALDGPESDTLIVMEAGDLGKSSALRKLAEQSDRMAALPCYLPEGGDIGLIARTIVREAGLALENGAEDALLSLLPPDRQLARREIEKLALYVQPETTITAQHVAACLGDASSRTMDDLVLATADGDRAGVDGAMQRLLAEGESPISLLRAAQRHFGRLYAAAGAVRSGQTADQAMAGLRPPVFFKVQPHFRSQLRRWTPERLGDVLRRLIDTEMDCKRTGMPAEILCSRAFLQISSLAGR